MGSPLFKAAISELSTRVTQNVGQKSSGLKNSAFSSAFSLIFLGLEQSKTDDAFTTQTTVVRAHGRGGDNGCFSS